MRKTKLLALFGSVCLALALVVTLSGGLAPALADKDKDKPPPGIEKKVEPVEPEISFVDGVPLVPDVMQVIVVSGSDYDMGYQFYQQVAQIFGLPPLEEVQREFTKEEITALKAYQWYLKEYAPEFIDMFRGMADGATDAGVPLSYTEVLAHYVRGLFGGLATYPGTEPPGSEEDKLPPKDDGCSGFAAWGSDTEDGELIAAGTSDFPEVKSLITFIALPETGNSYITESHSETEIGHHPSMNNKGLCYVHHGAGTDGNEEPGYGVALTTLHTLRFADDAAEALDMQLAYPSGTRAGGLWADTSGDAFNLECRDPETVRLAGDLGETDFLYATNNCLVPELEEFLSSPPWMGWDLVWVPHGGWHGLDEDAVRRNLFMWNALHNYQGEVDLDFAEMMLRFPGNPPDYPTYEEAAVGMYENEGGGWDSKIGCLGNESVGICLPDDGDEGLYYVAASGRVARVAYPQCPGYERYPIAPTYTFYELQLASSPADIVGAAKERAHIDLYYANTELRQLDYWDTPYAPLDAIFNQAATEWQKGFYYQGLAQETTGNEAVYNYAKALRAFTACQAYANQVYESLVPPATDPEDLGLDEWWGEWGEWESWLGSH